MNIDCHYYGTYYIARQAGWSDNEARKIAWAAQTVDELYFHVLKDVYDSCGDEDKKKLARVVTLVLATDLEPKHPYYVVKKKYIDMGSNSSLFTKAYRKFLMYSWVPFHFLPEIPSETKTIPEIDNNRIYAQYSAEYKAHFKQYEEVYKQDYKLICKTSTQLCMKMIEDAKDAYNEAMNDIKNTLQSNNDGDNEYTPNVDELLADSERKKDEALFRIGISMHVLADTWSHQNFCGNGDLFINSGDVEGSDFCTLDLGVLFVGKLNKTIKDESAFSSVWGGHGSVGHNPDVPSRYYLYRPSYLENFNYVINGERFMKAFYQMYTALSYIYSDTYDKSLFEKDFKQENYKSFKDKISLFVFDKKKEIPDKLYSVYDVLSYIFICTTNTKVESSDCDIWKKLKGNNGNVSFEDLPEYSPNDNGNDKFVSLRKFLNPAKEHRDFVIRQLYGCNDSFFKENADGEIKKIEDIISYLLIDKDIDDYEKEDVYYNPRTPIKDAITNAFSELAETAEKAAEAVIDSAGNIQPLPMLNEGLPGWVSNESVPSGDKSPANGCNSGVYDYNPIGDFHYNLGPNCKGDSRNA